MSFGQVKQLSTQRQRLARQLLGKAKLICSLLQKPQRYKTNTHGFDFAISKRRFTEEAHPNHRR